MAKTEKGHGNGVSVTLEINSTERYIFKFIPYAISMLHLDV